MSKNRIGNQEGVLHLEDWSKVGLTASTKVMTLQPTIKFVPLTQEFRLFDFTAICHSK